MTFHHVATLTVIFFCAMAGAAGAAQQSEQTYSKDAQTLCQPDMFRLCNDAVPDEDQIKACMQAKRKQLSPECRKAFDAEMKKHK